MKLSRVASTLALGLVLGAPAVQAQELFTGDVRSACESIMCLSTSKRPGECTPPLQRYFSIKHSKPSDTLKARKNFLELCPAANDSDEMRALVSALAGGAGQCDAVSLNQMTAQYIGTDGDNRLQVSNALPAQCAAYYNHPYVDKSGGQPMYVGTPERGGFWVEAADYAQAAKDYAIKIAREDQERSSIFGQVY